MAGELAREVGRKEREGCAETPCTDGETLLGGPDRSSFIYVRNIGLGPNMLEAQGQVVG